MTPVSADVLGSGQAAVLAALIRRAGRGPVTLRQLRDDTGLALNTVHRAVRALDAEGLVAFEPGLRGTLRPMVVALSVDHARSTAERGYDQTNGDRGACDAPAPFHIGPSHERPDGQ